MIYISSPGRTMTTSIAEYCNKNASIKSIQEPILSRLIFLTNNITHRIGYGFWLEYQLCRILIIYLKIISKLYPNVFLIDPFTSHSVCFRRLLQANFKELAVMQMSREKSDWIISSAKFQAYSWRAKIKKYIPFHSPIKCLRCMTTHEMYSLEFDYRMQNQLKFYFDFYIEYEELLSPFGVNRLNNFLIFQSVLTQNECSNELPLKNYSK